jgi:pre-mRNA-processing factor 6
LLPDNTDAARLAYAAGIKRCLDSVPLWVSAARLEERSSNVAKARALLEQVGPRVQSWSCRVMLAG